MKAYKVKFWACKQENHCQLKKQTDIIFAISESEIENILRRKGWKKIHNLKIRKVDNYA